MPVQICSCEGLNPKCEKCFGSGYVEAAAKPAVQAKPALPAKKSNSRYASFLPDDLKSASRKELDNSAVRIVEALDLKSKKQMQLLNSIPFNTNTFRRDFKNKFDSLNTLENEKQFLRGELDIVAKATSGKNSTHVLPFRHFLSDKEIDVGSNKQLKTLIRDYKKQKDKPGSHTPRPVADKKTKP